MAKGSLTVNWTDTNTGEDAYEVQVSTDSISMVVHEYDRAFDRKWMNIGRAPADAESFTFELELPYSFCRVRTRAIKDGHKPGPWTPREGALYSTVDEGAELEAPTDVTLGPASGTPPDTTPPVVVPPPPSVTDLTVSEGAGNPNSELDLSFTAVDDGTGNPAKFQVRYSTVQNFAFSAGLSPAAGTAASPSQPNTIGETVNVTIEGLLPGTTYYVKVQSYRGTLGTNAVLGGISNEASDATSGDIPTQLEAPTNLDPSQETVAGGATIFSWDAVAGASGYALRVHKQGNAYLPQDSTNYVYFGTLTQTSIELTLVAGTNYDWWVHAYDSAGVLGEARGTVVQTTPPAGTNPTVSNLIPSPASVHVNSVQVMTVTLSNTYTADVTVAIANSDATKVSAPTSVVVPAGSLTATFNALGLAEGSATLTTSYNSSSAQSTVTVSAAQQQGGSWPNQPSNHVLKTDWGFTTLSGNGWVDAYNGASLISIGTSQQGPVSPPNGLRCQFPVGHPGGYGVGNINYQYSPGTLEMYVGIYIMFRSPFHNPAAGNKLFYVHAQFQNKHPCIPLVLGSGSTLGVALAVQGDSSIDNRHLVSGFPFLGTIQLSPTTSNFVVGQWNLVELVVRESTSTTAQNGIARWWCNGVLLGNYTNVNTAQWGGYQGIIINPVFNGPGNKTQEDFIYYDHARITGV